MKPPSAKMVVCTNWHFSSSAELIWPLLCNSRMVQSGNLLFKFGLPQPLECRLPNGPGGVGSERECISDRGTIHQRILVWKPAEKLTFRMERSDFEPMMGINGMEDSFDLVSKDTGVLVTRTTTVTLRGHFLVLRKIGLFIGLKQVHRYVFSNWQISDMIKQTSLEKSTSISSHNEK